MPDDVKDSAAGAPEGKPAADAGTAAADKAAADAAQAVADQAAAEALTKVLVLPKDSPLDPKAVDRVREFATANKVSPEIAKAMLETAHTEVGEALKVIEAAQKPGGALYATRVAEFHAAALAHPELGAGDERKLETATLKAQLVAAEYWPELKPLLEETGRGSDPAVLLGLNRIAKAFGEQKLARGDGAPAEQPKKTMRDMYAPNGDKLPEPAGAA